MATHSDIVETKLSAHEVICAERYRGINARLKRIEVIGIGATVTIMGAMGWVIDLLIGLVAKL
jgi:hypothetical protein